MTALPRLQQALVDARPRPRAAPRVLAAAAVAGAAAFAVASLAGGEPDPERAATPPVRVAIGQPVDPIPAGDPPEGWIEMRAVDPVTGKPIVGLYFTYQGDPCWDVGAEETYREYPVRDGGSCSTTAGGRLPTPFSFGVSSGPGHATTIAGKARTDVERLEIAGFGDPREVPLSAHGGWFVAIPPSFEGRLELTAHLRGGGRHSESVQVPMRMPPGPTPDPVEQELRARLADVDQIAVIPRAGTPATTFMVAVPPADDGGLYSVTIDGPAGSDCKGELGETFGIAAGRESGRVRPLPPHRQAPFTAVDEPGYSEALRTAPWCPGRYRVGVRYIASREKGPGTTVARLEFTVR